MSFIDIVCAFDTNEEVREALEIYGRAALEDLLRHWLFLARPDQRPPCLTDGSPPWGTWVVLGGRGAGKTRTGAEWVRGMAMGHPGFCEPSCGRIALVGETHADARDVMIEGPAGLLAVHPDHERPVWSPSLRRLSWSSGAVAHVFSAEDPDALRGPQFEAAWSDELAKWRHAEATWDMLQFGLRLGTLPRQVVTTTPRPIPLLKRLLAAGGTVVSRASTHANADNLAPGFVAAIVERYGGTRLGRQEIDGDIIEDRPDALWTRDLIERARVAAAPPLARIVVAVDPPVSAGPRADACGIVAAGIDAEGSAYVIEDGSLRAAPPLTWAGRAVALFRRLEADALVVETNQGGEMAAAVIAQIDAGVPVTDVRATRGKYLRAEPVAALYAKGRVHHLGAFPELEDEMCDFGPRGLSSGRSPDRLDALVWAITHLALGASRQPRIRML